MIFVPYFTCITACTNITNSSFTLYIVLLNQPDWCSYIIYSIHTLYATIYLYFAKFYLKTKQHNTNGECDGKF